jgi:hypothetical protein
MASTTEKSFGSRIEKAKKLKTFLEGFTNYQPATGEFSIDGLIQSITYAESLNPEVARLLINYRQVVATRRDIYFKTPNSIKKLITPINAYNRGTFGKNSATYLATNSLVTKIRGERIKDIKVIDSNNYSVSQQSYGSLLLNFQNLINDLESLDILYNPTNSAITISNLLTIKNQAERANEEVTVAFAALTPKQNERLIAFQVLSSKAQRIKDLVQSQYGIDSSEFKLVKGLNI